MEPVSVLVSAPFILAVFCGLMGLERLYPLRRSVESKKARIVRNLSMAALGAATVRLAEIPVILPLARMVEQRGWGLVNQIGSSLWLEVLLSLLLLDYTLYLWHRLTHRVPLLWRFHLVHHVDLDMDASTGLRFHLGELLLSIPWRAGQVFFIGVSPLAYSAWQVMLFVLVLFHHSNLALPLRLERRLVRIIVTPRMHGIHHSTMPKEMNSNWSSGLTLWDRMHGTLKLNVSQNEITIGVPGYCRPGQVGFARLLVMPCARSPVFPEQSTTPRPRSTLPEDHLV